MSIVALRDERGSYNQHQERGGTDEIVALRDERGSYNHLNNPVVS